MRQKVIAGNWKMNTCIKKGLNLATEINVYINMNIANKVKVILGVPFTHIKSVADIVDYKNISVAAQNCASEEFGAYTGEVSAEMVKSAGAAFTIIGHSERRKIFGETDSVIARKINFCLKNNMFPIFCCGETLQERNENNHFQIVESQIKNGLGHLDHFNMERIIIAYEPVWAIGTGVNASPKQAQEMHSFIRKLISNQFGAGLSQKISILYGGSMKPENAKDLINQKDIDGGLIGGASLKSKSFIELIDIACQAK